MSGTGSPVLIREAVFADLPGIIHVFMGDETGQHGDVWSDETRPAYEQAMRGIIASQSNTLFVAEQAGQIVGTFQVTLIPGLVAKGRLRAKLESVHVRPEYRGKGLGGRMVSHALVFAKGQGAGMMELTSNKRRKDAHRFYENLGFERSHEGFKKTL